jgi:hypothetical protein
MLRFEHGDRVRLVVASCLTLLALPVLLSEGKDSRAERPPTVAAVAPRGGALASPLGQDTTSTATKAAATAAPPSATPVAPPATTDGDPPGFLSSVAPPPSNSITLVVPTAAPSTSESGLATYRRWPAGAPADPCSVWFLKVGTKVTVTNLDNGHTVQCTIAARTGVPAGDTIVLDTATFSRLADLIEAPIPVTISWS